MSEPKLSAADSARLKAETYAPLVESDLRAIEAHVGDGTLSPERLTDLIAWYETGMWTGSQGASCRLDSDYRAMCKGLAAISIRKQHGGVFRAGGYDWRSLDGGSGGVDLKAFVPGGAG